MDISVAHFFLLSLFFILLLIIVIVMVICTLDISILGIVISDFNILGNGIADFNILGTVVTDLNILAANTETAFHDFEQETFSGVKNGIEMIGTIAESISTDLQNCEAIEPEFQQLIDMAKKLKSPWSFAYHVGKDLLTR